MRHQPVLTDGMVAEEGSVPGALGVFLPGAFAAAADVAGTPEPVAPTELIREKEREMLTDFEGPYQRRRGAHADLSGDDARQRQRPHEPGRPRQPRPRTGRASAIKPFFSKSTNA